MLPGFLNRNKLPHKPGIYQFLDKDKKILYVGKAIDLYSRVSSYFNKDVIGKTAVLVENIRDVETIIVESELEALILEANLIKEYLPSFNVILKDDKDYLYIGLTKDLFPKVVTIRKQDLKNMKKYWGPFPSSRTLRDTLKQLRRIFPWCSSVQTRFVYLNPNPVRVKKACFYYHLGLCPGACVDVISKEEYQKIIKKFSKFLDGKKEELIAELSEEMSRLSNEQKFEEAAKVKKVLEGVSYLTQTNRVSKYLENPNFLEQENEQALRQLQKDLNLPKLPERIEGYDISNLGGKEAVGSMVVLTNGEIDKSQYRRFKIKKTGRPNDVGMHREMLRRRLKHPEWPLPNLIIMDGGRAQARAVKLDIPVFGLAKRAEWLYPPEGEIIKLPKKSLSLRLLQRLRDESHRFAITYHRKLRDIIK